jgi:hypothetical protein
VVPPRVVEVVMVSTRRKATGREAMRREVSRRKATGREAMARWKALARWTTKATLMMMMWILIEFPSGEENTLPGWW